MNTPSNDGRRNAFRSFVRRHLRFSPRELAIVLLLGGTAGVLAGKFAAPDPDPWAPTAEPVAAHCASTLAIAAAVLADGQAPEGNRPALSDFYPECY